MKLSRVLYFTFFAAVFACANALAAQTQFNKAQVKAIQQVMHDYLVNQPEVLIEASKTLQKRELIKAKKESIAAIAANAAKVFDDTNKPVLGNPNGKIVMVEFFDYQCPHCKPIADIVDSLIKENPDLKVVFAEFPIFGDVSKFAAQAAIASTKQGKYNAFHDALLEKGFPMDQNEVLRIAKKVGLNISKLKKDMKSDVIDKQIKDNFDIAGKIRVMGAPSFAIGNLSAKKYNYVPGEVDKKTLQAAIDKVK